MQVELASAPPPNQRWAGFYNPWQDRITIIDRSRATWPFILAHELTHALQEQYCHGAFSEEGTRNEDERLARRAAFEGEAHLVAAAVALRRARLDRLIAAEDLPDLGRLDLIGLRLGRALGLRRDLPPPDQDAFLFPYTQGLSFAQAVVRARGRGLRGLDGVLLDPPRSTAEILHPEKYLAAAREKPLAVPIPGPPSAGATLVRSGTRGERGIRAALEERLPSARAQAAAEGWAGDAFAVYGAPGAETTLWETVWENDARARVFAAAYGTARRAAEVRVEDGRRVTIREVRRARLF